MAEATTTTSSTNDNAIAAFYNDQLRVKEQQIQDYLDSDDISSLALDSPNVPILPTEPVATMITNSIAQTSDIDTYWDLPKPNYDIDEITKKSFSPTFLKYFTPERVHKIRAEMSAQQWNYDETVLERTFLGLRPDLTDRTTMMLHYEAITNIIRLTNRHRGHLINMVHQLHTNRIAKKTEYVDAFLINAVSSKRIDTSCLVQYLYSKPIRNCVLLAHLFAVGKHERTPIEVANYCDTFLSINMANAYRDVFVDSCPATVLLFSVRDVNPTYFTSFKLTNLLTSVDLKNLTTHEMADILKLKHPMNYILGDIPNNEKTQNKNLAPGLHQEQVSTPTRSRQFTLCELQRIYAEYRLGPCLFLILSALQETETHKLVAKLYFALQSVFPNCASSIRDTIFDVANYLKFFRHFITIRHGDSEELVLDPQDLDTVTQAWGSFSTEKYLPDVDLTQKGVLESLDSRLDYIKPLLSVLIVVVTACGGAKVLTLLQAKNFMKDLHTFTTSIRDMGTLRDAASAAVDDLLGGFYGLFGGKYYNPEQRVIRSAASDWMAFNDELSVLIQKNQDNFWHTYHDVTFDALKEKYVNLRKKYLDMASATPQHSNLLRDLNHTSCARMEDLLDKINKLKSSTAGRQEPVLIRLVGPTAVGKTYNARTISDGAASALGKTVYEKNFNDPYDSGDVGQAIWKLEEMFQAKDHSDHPYLFTLKGVAGYNPNYADLERKGKPAEPLILVATSNIIWCIESKTVSDLQALNRRTDYLVYVWNPWVTAMKNAGKLVTPDFYKQHPSRFFLLNNMWGYNNNMCGLGARLTDIFGAVECELSMEFIIKMVLEMEKMNREQQRVTLLRSSIAGDPSLAGLDSMGPIKYAVEIIKPKSLTEKELSALYAEIVRVETSCSVSPSDELEPYFRPNAKAVVLVSKDDFTKPSAFQLSRSTLFEDLKKTTFYDGSSEEECDVDQETQSNIQKRPLLILTGEPGIGKTRLIETCLDAISIPVVQILLTDLDLKTVLNKIIPDCVLFFDEAASSPERLQLLYALSTEFEKGALKASKLIATMNAETPIVRSSGEIWAAISRRAVIFRFSASLPWDKKILYFNKVITWDQKKPYLNVTLTNTPWSWYAFANILKTQSATVCYSDFSAVLNNYLQSMPVVEPITPIDGIGRVSRFVDYTYRITINAARKNFKISEVRNNLLSNSSPIRAFERAADGSEKNVPLLSLIDIAYRLSPIFENASFADLETTLLSMNNHKYDINVPPFLVCFLDEYFGGLYDADEKKLVFFIVELPVDVDIPELPMKEVCQIPAVTLPPENITALIQKAQCEQVKKSMHLDKLELMVDIFVSITCFGLDAAMMYLGLHVKKVDITSLQAVVQAPALPQPPPVFDPTLNISDSSNVTPIQIKDKPVEFVNTQRRGRDSRQAQREKHERKQQQQQEEQVVEDNEYLRDASEATPYQPDNRVVTMGTPTIGLFSTPYSITTATAPVIFHCIGRDAKMSAGAAKDLVEIYHLDRESIAARAAGDRKYVIDRCDKKVIVHLITKELTYTDKSTVGSISAALVDFFSNERLDGIQSVASTLLGCGHDKLSPQPILELIEVLAHQYGLHWKVYTQRNLQPLKPTPAVSSLLNTIPPKLTHPEGTIIHDPNNNTRGIYLNNIVYQLYLNDDSSAQWKMIPLSTNHLVETTTLVGPPNWKPHLMNFFALRRVAFGSFAAEELQAVIWAIRYGPATDCNGNAQPGAMRYFADLPIPTYMRESNVGLDNVVSTTPVASVQSTGNETFVVQEGLTRSNVVFLYDQQKNFINSGLLVVENFIITVNHSVHRVKFAKFYQTDKFYPVEFKFGNSSLDCAIVSIPDKTFPSRRSMLPYFMLKDDMLKFIKRSGSVNVQIRVVDEKDGAIEKHCGSFSATTINRLSASCFTTMMAMAFTRAGDCGSLYFVLDKSAQATVVGMHHAGSGVVSTGITLYRERVEELLQSARTGLCPDTQFNANSELWDEEVGDLDPIDLYRHQITAPYVGLAEKPLHTPFATKLHRSGIQFGDEIGAEPSVLYAGDPRWEKELTPMQEGVLRYLPAQPIQLNQDEINDAAYHIGEEISRTMIANRMTTRTLTVDEALTGARDEWPCTKAIDGTSSAGYHWGFGRFTKKGQYMVWNDEKQMFQLATCAEGLELAKRLNTTMKSLRAGEPGVFPFIPSLKDELLPVAKTRGPNAKTRIFWIAPLDFVILHRRLFLTAISNIMELHNELPIKVGIAPNCHQWTKLFSGLAKLSDTGFDADFKNFDGGVPFSFQRAIPIIYSIIYNRTSTERPEKILRDNIARFALHQALEGPVVQVGKLLRKMDHGQMSGQPATAIDNSLIVWMLYYIVFCRAMRAAGRPELATYFTFRRHVALIIYGDDSACTISHDYLKLFNMEVFIGIALTMGFVATPANKTENVSESQPLETFTFLKRAFRRVGDQVYAPLSLASIIKSLEWVRMPTGYQYRGEWNVATNLEVIWNHIKIIFCEFAMHGPSTYEWALEKFFEQAATYGTSFVLPTYVEAVGWSGYTNLEALVPCNIRSPFVGEIVDGTKTVEIRKNVGKWSDVKPGDRLVINPGTDNIISEIYDVARYDNLRECLIVHGMDALPGKTLEEAENIYLNIYGNGDCEFVALTLTGNYIRSEQNGFCIIRKLQSLMAANDTTTPALVDPPKADDVNPTSAATPGGTHSVPDNVGAEDISELTRSGARTNLLENVWDKYIYSHTITVSVDTEAGRLLDLQPIHPSVCNDDVKLMNNYHKDWKGTMHIKYSASLSFTVGMRLRVVYIPPTFSVADINLWDLAMISKQPGIEWDVGKGFSHAYTPKPAEPTFYFTNQDYYDNNQNPKSFGGYLALFTYAKVVTGTETPTMSYEIQKFTCGAFVWNTYSPPGGVAPIDNGPLPDWVCKNYQTSGHCESDSSGGNGIYFRTGGAGASYTRGYWFARAFDPDNARTITYATAIDQVTSAYVAQAETSGVPITGIGHGRAYEAYDGASHVGVTNNTSGTLLCATQGPSTGHYTGVESTLDCTGLHPQMLQLDDNTWTPVSITNAADAISTDYESSFCPIVDPGMTAPVDMFTAGYKKPHTGTSAQLIDTMPAPALDECIVEMHDFLERTGGLQSKVLAQFLNENVTVRLPPTQTYVYQLYNLVNGNEYWYLRFWTNGLCTTDGDNANKIVFSSLPIGIKYIATIPYNQPLPALSKSAKRWLRVINSHDAVSVRKHEITNCSPIGSVARISSGLTRGELERLINEMHKIHKCATVDKILKRQQRLLPIATRNILNGDNYRGGNDGR